MPHAAVVLLAFPCCLGSAFSRYYYILERLSQAQSYVLLINMNETAMVEDLFGALLGAVSEDHSSKVLSHMVSVLAGCLNMADTVEQGLLDRLLSPLVEPQASTHPAARRLAGEVIVTSGDKIKPQLTHFLQVRPPFFGLAWEIHLVIC